MQSYAARLRRQQCVAREQWVPYAAQAAPSVEAAVAKIREGLEELQSADLAQCSDEELGAAVLAVSDAASRLIAQETRLVHEFDRRRAYRADACVGAAGWLRHQSTVGPGAAKRRVARADLLATMPQLRQAFEAGQVRVEHVDAILHRATPTRRATIAEHDATLTDLARTAEPRHVAVAVQRIIDASDRDGTDDPKPCAAEDLRGVSLREGMYGLGDLSATTSVVLSELLRRTRDVYDRPDPADTPPEQRRTPQQRFHDALVAALTVALDQHPNATVSGLKVHSEVLVDLFTLLGADDLAHLKTRLASGQPIDAEWLRHLLATTTNPTVRLVLSLGPWRPVAVGRVRSLPPWLRLASHLAHPHCIAPGCDLPAAVCDSDHLCPYGTGGETSLTNAGPMCRPHNNLKHDDNWTVTVNLDTGEVTWTNHDHTKTITLPPPDI